MIMDRLHTDLRITTLLALANVIARSPPQAAEKVAAIQFKLDEWRRRRLLVQELD